MQLVPDAPRILVVDDEPAARSGLAELLREEGYSVRTAADGFKALGVADDWRPDILVTDLSMPGLDGLGLIDKLTERYGELSSVVVTAHGSVENAVDAMRRGASDYLTKPVDLHALLAVLARLERHRKLSAEATALREALDQRDRKGEFVVASRGYRRVVETLDQVRASGVNVVLFGESGTGKETLARHLHGTANEAPFEHFRVDALDPTLVERELFGFEPGAFEGAKITMDGAWQRAHGGTLFVEGIDRLDAHMQERLYEALRDGAAARMGGSRAEPVDLRVVASSESDLREAVDAGRFREDLYYQLAIVSLRVPTLRERHEDTIALAQVFFARERAKHRKRLRGMSPRALSVMASYPWPGNVPELEAAIVHAVAVSAGPDLQPRDLPAHVLRGGESPQDEAPRIPGASMAELERYAILKTLESVGGSTSKAAKILGISPRKIQYRLADYRALEEAS